VIITTALNKGLGDSLGQGRGFVPDVAHGRSPAHHGQTLDVQRQLRRDRPRRVDDDQVLGYGVVRRRYALRRRMSVIPALGNAESWGFPKLHGIASIG
jgi:hypothetical protein